MPVYRVVYKNGLYIDVFFKNISILKDNIDMDKVEIIKNLNSIVLRPSDYNPSSYTGKGNSHFQ